MHKGFLFCHGHVQKLPYQIFHIFSRIFAARRRRIYRTLPVTGRASVRVNGGDDSNSVADLIEYFPPLLNEHQYMNTQGVAGGDRYIEDIIDRGKPVTDGIIMDI